jgi:hypothetical protein
MRIKFIDTGEEYQLSGINKGVSGRGTIQNTVVAGRYVAQHGVLCEYVEDITEYRTEIDEDGNEIQVEVIPEVIEVDIG